MPHDVRTNKPECTPTSLGLIMFIIYVAGGLDIARDVSTDLVNVWQIFTESSRFLHNDITKQMISMLYSASRLSYLLTTFYINLKIKSLILIIRL